MRLSAAGFAVGAATIWGAAIFVIGGVNALVPGYGQPVLDLVVSLYPGYDADGTVGDLMLGTAYALFDGLAAGFIFATLYNLVARRTAPRPPEAPAAPTTDGGISDQGSR